MVRALTITILFCAFAVTGLAESPSIRVLTVQGAINPVTADYLRKNLHAAAQQREPLVVIEMDTPGGLDTAMREIVKDLSATSGTGGGIRHSRRSAGRIGRGGNRACGRCTRHVARAPISVLLIPSPSEKSRTRYCRTKIVNDAEAYVEGIARKRGRNVEVARSMVRQSISLPAEKAQEQHIVDVIAIDRADLFEKLDGRVVHQDGKDVTLRLAGVQAEIHGMNARQQILDAVSNPNVAYVLMMLGFLGLFFELSNPGVILPGVIGGISLILAFFAFQTLPVNYAGVLLIIFALILFIAEIKIVSHGMLAIGGIVSMIFGSLLLFESPEPYLRLSWSVIITTVLATALFFLLVVSKAVQAHRRKPVTGREGLIGECGSAESALAPDGKVFVRGEYWDAWSEELIAQGEKVTVIEIDGMRLKVRKAPEAKG